MLFLLSIPRALNFHKLEAVSLAAQAFRTHIFQWTSKGEICSNKYFINT